MSKSKFKTWLRRIHLWIGLSSGLIVFIISITGACYAFEKEIREVIHRDLYRAENQEGQVLPLDSLVKTVQAQYKKQKIKQVICQTDDRTIQVNLKNKTSVFVHPKSAKVIGTLNQETEALAVILKIHRQLYLGDIGKKITGISCLVFFISLLTGLVLWFPTKRKYLTQRLKIAAHKGKKRFNFDLHRSLGFYASFVLLVSALSGLVFSFKWAEKGLYFVAGSVKKEKKYFSDTLQANQSASLEPIVANLRKNFPDKTIVLVLPEENKAAIRASVQLGSFGVFTANNHYFYDRFTGKELGHLLFNAQSLGEKLRASNYNFHTGKTLGLFGEILVFLASLIAASLPITGFIIWYNRKKKKAKAVVS